MGSWIELLCRARDFATIASHWPDAVETPQGIVIPRILSVGPDTWVSAEIEPGETVTFRPMVHRRPGFASMRRRVLAALEQALGVELGDEPVQTQEGVVSLDDEWGDFAVVVRTDCRRDRSHPEAARAITKSFSAPS